jgi:hypothetical protein
MPIEFKMLILFLLVGLIIPILGIATVENDLMQNIIKAAMWIWAVIAIVAIVVVIILA